MPNPLSVLVLEDRPDDAELMIAELHVDNPDLNWTRVETEDEFLEAIEQPLDVILADFSLPHFDAIRALNLVREKNLNIPVIVVTGAIDDNMAVQTMKAGAADYVLKDRLARLPAAVESAVSEAENTLKQKATERSLALSDANLDSQLARQTAITLLGELALAGASQERLITLAIDACNDLLPADFVKVMELLPGGRELLIRAGRGWNDDIVGVVTVPNDSESQAGFTLLKDEPVLVLDLEQETRFTAPQLLMDHGVRSGISIVIRQIGRPFGVLAVHSKTPGVFVESDAEFVKSLSNVLGSAITRRIIESESAQLGEISRVATSATDLGEVYDQLAESIGRLLPCDRMVIALIEGDEAYDAYVTGRDIPGIKVGFRYPIEESGMALFEKSREPRVFEIDSGEDRFQKSSGPTEHSSNPPSIAADALARAYDVGLCSMMIAPLIWNAKIIGTLQVRSQHTDIYGDREIEVASKIADQIAGAIANAQAYEALKRESNVRAALSEIGRLVSSSLDFQTMAAGLSDLLRSIFRFDGLLINQVDLDTKSITNIFEEGTCETSDPGRNTGPLAGTITEQVVSTGQGFLLRVDSPEDTIGQYPMTVVAIARGTRAFLSAPLVSEGRPIGTFQLRSPDIDAFSDDDVAIAERVAGQIAGAVANAQLYDATRREANERAVLAEIGRIITSGPDIEDVYEQLSESIGQIIPFDRLVIALSAPDDSDTWVDAYATGQEIPGFRTGLPYAREHSPAPLFSTHRAPIILNEEILAEIPHWQKNERIARSVGLQSMMIAQLIWDDQLIGALNFRSRLPNAYGNSDLVIAGRVADQIAGAVANAQLYDRTRQQARDEALLSEVGRLASSTLSIEDVFAGIAELVTEAVPSERISIDTVDNEAGTFTIRHIWGATVAGRLPESEIPLEGSVTGEVVSTGQTVMINITNGEPELLERYPGLAPGLASGIRAFLSVPMIYRERVNGVLHLRSSIPHAFDVTLVSLAERLATQIAGALENAQARERIEKSETNYRDLVETAHEMIWRTDAEGRWIFVNPATESIYGYTAEEMLGRPFTDFQDPDTAEQATRDYERHLSGGKVRGYETIIISKSGQKVTILVDAEIEMDASGAVVGTRGISRDVTAERDAQWRLGERLKELTCLYGVVDLLRDNSPVEKVASDIANLIPTGWQYPEITVARVSFDQLSFQTEGYVSTEWKQTSDIVVDGQTRGLVEVCYTEPKASADEGPFQTEERNLIDRIAELLADAIEGRAAGERVRLQGAAVDASVDAIIAANRNGEIVLANPAAAEMFGHSSAADLVGTALTDLMPESYRPAHLEGLARLNRGEKPKMLGRTIEVDGLKADGRVFPLEMSINSLEGSGKAAFVSVLRDITERRESERESHLRSAALGAAADMIVITDSDGVIEYVNDAYTRETGYEPSEVVGKNPRSMKSGKQDSAYYKRLWSTIKAGRVWQGELLNRRKNGSVYTEEMTITPVAGADGEISNFVAIKRDISDRKRNEEDLVRLATTDTLTGLSNRHQFNQMLEQAVELLSRRGGQGALITIDLDGFKYINDAYGHGAGDELLTRIASSLRERLRASDPVARIGGDEFAVILHDASPDDAQGIADELVSLIADCTLVFDGQQASITACAGVAAFPDAEASPVDLMAFADIALYAAKDVGRGRTVLYSNLEEGRETISSLQRTRTMIVDALRHDRIRIHWQPIFRSDDLQPYEYEILARLEDEDGVLRPPVDFIPQAEVLDLMGDIDRRVIDLALQTGANYHRHAQPVRLAVNISARSLTCEMVDYIVEAADETGYPLSNLTVEITETAVLSVSDETKAAIKRLTDTGASLSMDDFGSGAASFSNLEALPFKYMKLDGSYVQDLATNQRGRELVTGLTQLAHTLGLQIIAEYVQDDETVEFLREIGVEYLQGFHLGEPVPVPDPALAPAT